MAPDFVIDFVSEFSVCVCERRVWAPRISTLYHVEYIFTTGVRIGKRTARLYENLL